MYTLNEYLPIFVGDDLPERGWDSGMYCLETDRTKILRSNLLRGFVSCFAFMLVDKGWMTIHYNGRDLTLHPNDLYTYSPGLPVDVIATSDDFHGLCLIADDFAHLHGQMLCGIRRQRLFRLVQLYDGQIGQMYEVVDGWCLDGDMLIGHQAKAVEIVGSGDDIDWEAWRISVQVVGMQRQVAAVVVNRHPPFVNQHKGEAGNESPQQVDTKYFHPVCFHTVHPAVPAFFGQVVAYKYWQIFIQRVHIGGKDTNKRAKCQIYLSIFEREYLRPKVKGTNIFL